MRKIILGFALLFASAPAWSQDLRIILDRQEDGVVGFLALPVADVPDMLGGEVIGLADEAGNVPFSTIQRTGTAEQGDAAIAQTTLSIEGEAVLIETMSMMAHPKDLDVAFHDPFDGYTAMSVCTATDPGRPLRLAELDLYLGFYAYRVAGFSDLSLTFGNAAPIAVEVREYVDGEFMRATQTRIGAGESLPLGEASARVGMLYSYLWLLVGAALVALLAAWFRRRFPMGRAPEET